MAWQQKFEKCCGHLTLRVDGPDGPVIRWPDRGCGGRYTWSANDPQGEVRDISAWTGENCPIRLFAAVMETDVPEDAYCEMATLQDGILRLTWRIDADEDHEIGCSQL